MTRWLIGIVVLFVAVVVGISLFLTPNNLMNCSDSPSALTGCSKVDAIIAVSGGDTKSRTQKAIDLYQSGWSDRLIFSGAASDKSGPSNAKVMKEQAVAQGVPESAITIEGSSNTTAQNAQYTASILEKDGIKTAIIVTSRYHMKRTMLEFTKASPSVTFRASPADSDNQWSSAWWWLNPFDWYLAVGEIVKIVLFYMGVS